MAEMLSELILSVENSALAEKGTPSWQPWLSSTQN